MTKRGGELDSVETVGGKPAGEFADRLRYTELVAIDPCERFHLGDTGDMSMRVVDLVAPIGKGTRQLIVSPPNDRMTGSVAKIWPPEAAPMIRAAR